MKKPDENFLHQNLFVFLIKKKLIRKKLKLLQQRQSARKNQKNASSSCGEVINGARYDKWH